jgi:hypothetical protein
MNEKRLKYQNYLDEFDYEDFLYEYDNRLNSTIERIYDCEVEMERRLKIVDKAKKLLEKLKSKEYCFTVEAVQYQEGHIIILEHLLED